MRARVEWLSQIINTHQVAGVTQIESVETGARIGSSELLEPARPANGLVSSGRNDRDAEVNDSEPRVPTQDVSRTQEQCVDDGGQSLELAGSGYLAAESLSSPLIMSFAGFRNPPTASDETAVVSSPELPVDAAARRFVDAYFRNVNRAYPFVNRNKVLSDLERFGTLTERSHDPDSTLLYLIMAIGCTTLARAGQVPEDTASKFEIAYSGIIQECLFDKSIESMQILVLLVLYSLFDPAAASVWSVIGTVSRQAVLFGLTRRTAKSGILLGTDAEFQHRLFWSVYVLDRMISSSLGLPPTLTDENMDVPLPGLTVEEFASSERTYYTTMLQTSRHVIQLRQLEDRILQQIHLRKTSEAGALTGSERRAIVQGIQLDIEDWYKSGCLVSPLDQDNVPIHSSVTWLSARYYHLLVLLHYPCHFNQCGALVSRAELLRFTQKHLQSTSALFQQRQLPLNRITLCRLLPVSLLLMHGFGWCTSTNTVFPARDEAFVVLTIFEAFPRGWAHARQGAAVMRKFLNVISGTTRGADQSLQFDHNPIGQGGQSKDESRRALRAVIDSMLELMYGLLGRTTSFAFPNLPGDDEDGSGILFGSSAGSLLYGPASLGSDMSPPWAWPLSSNWVDDNNDVDFGWAGLERGFL